MTGVEVCNLLTELRYDFFSGVPDSTLGPLFTVLTKSREYTYVPSVREDAAIGLAVGAYLGGRSPVVLMQNSGLGLAINALASLASLYKIPLLLLIGWRGFAKNDAPEHEMMGRASPILLEALDIPFWAPSKDQVRVALVDASYVSRHKEGPTALLIKEHVIV